MAIAKTDLRAFISYSHNDRAIVAAVRATLQNCGLETTSDAELRPGQGFTEQIQGSITHAHVFVPILTPRSHERGWVHQEIGFAVALRVPCVPVCIGKLPEGMIAMSHAITVGEDLSGLEDGIRRVDFGNLIEQAGRNWAPPAHVADEPQERSETIERYSNAAFYARGGCHVRVAGGFSSFSLPDEEPNHVTWRAAYGNSPRGAHAYGLLRREHNALKRHVATGGLSMILDLGRDLDSERGTGVTRTRLCVLREFLTSAQVPHAMSRILAVREHPPDLMLSVGDWFFARSRAARVATGVVHTTFTTHAPTVSRCIAEFDRNVESLMRSQGTRPDQSYAYALAQIDERIRELPPHPNWTCD